MNVNNSTVIAALDAICEKFGLVINWTSDNIIPYIQDLMQRVVKYEIATSILWLILGVILLIIATIGTIGLFSVFKKKKETNGYIDIDNLIFQIFCIIVCIAAGVILIIYQTVDIISCNYLPERIFLRILNETIK